MREIVTLSIASYRGSIGGEHYYGALRVQTKMTRIVRSDGSIGHVTRMGHGTTRHPHDGHELMRPIGAKEALYLNKKDGDRFVTPSSRLKPGDLVNRFNDIESIITAAIETFPTIFDDSDILMYERKRYSDDYEILVAPAEARAAIGGTNNRRVREEWLMANGYMVLEDAPPADTMKE